VSNRTFPSKNIYIKDPTAPADVVSINGYVIEGRVHAHMTMTDEEKAFGGHLEPDTHVFTFAIVTLGVFGDGVDLSRVDDKTYR
jgi:predicted DNA-binding protein with PD1-like motif